jgi:predicted lipid-binding transport protein (Tim44 family)
MSKKAKNCALAFFTIAVCLLCFWHGAAEEARLGGGKSFGSSPSYQRSAPALAPSPTSPQVSPSPPAQRPVAGPAASPMGRWGGMLGGLLNGGLIGSLLFVGAHAYGGPGLMDLAILGSGLFLLYRFLRVKRMAAASPAPAGPLSFDRGPALEWENSIYPPPSAEPTAAEQPALPSGFDADEFLKGANAIYARLQTSWDKRDHEDIRQFASPEGLREIQRQAQEDPKPGKTELISINPRITEVRDVNNQTVVSIFYNVMMRENGTEMAKQVR